MGRNLKVFLEFKDQDSDYDFQIQTYFERDLDTVLHNYK